MCARTRIKKVKKPFLILSVFLVSGCTAIQDARDRAISNETKAKASMELEETGPDNWGQITDEKPRFYAASDVPESQIELTRKWYEIGSNAWGNYGPLEFWIVGKDEQAAADLDKKYCEIYNERDPSFRIRECLKRGHNLVSYAKEGNAGLNMRRSEHEQWSGFIITMSAKYPSPEEEDYKSVVLHEYFHVYQHAHIYTKDHSEREEKNQKNPWWAEGGAEYMALLLYSKQEGVRPGYLKERMENKLRSLRLNLSFKSLRKNENIRDIPYGSRAMVAYDLGAWFIAFLINKTSEEAYRLDFFKSLDEKGFEGAFLESFGSSSKDMLEEFHNEFLLLETDEKMKIIPG